MPAGTPCLSTLGGHKDAVHSSRICGTPGSPGTRHIERCVTSPLENTKCGQAGCSPRQLGNTHIRCASLTLHPESASSSLVTPRSAMRPPWPAPTHQALPEFNIYIYFFIKFRLVLYFSSEIFMSRKFFSVYVRAYLIF